MYELGGLRIFFNAALALVIAASPLKNRRATQATQMIAIGLKDLIQSHDTNVVKR